MDTVQPRLLKLPYVEPMDWDRLCRFDLRDGCPGCFFEQFRRRVRNLKSLRFGFIKDERKYSYRPITCGENSAAVCNFLDSINGLDELYITNFESDTGYLVSSTLKHSSTLRTLEFYNPLEGIYGRVIAPIWPTEVLEQLQELHQLAASGNRHVPCGQ